MLQFFWFVSNAPYFYSMFNAKVTNPMKTVLQRITRFSLALIIPAALMVGCQEDITEPQSAKPPKDKIVIPK